MNLRSHGRMLLMQAAGLARADRLALSMQNRRSGSHGLVIGVHDTPPSVEVQFRRQLEWVARNFTITNLEAFAKLWEEPAGFASNARKPPILFTFDDGRESNYTIAAPVLESFGGRGIFFIVPSFAECAADEALAFYRSRINPSARPGDEERDDWKPMRPSQIEELAARGHTIGNHTLTHERLVGLSADQLERELGDSARKLSAWTKRPVDAFAWTFGWDAIDAKAWNVARRLHRFCFAPCPGQIDSQLDSPALLWRREVEANCSASEYRFIYSGLADPWWRSRRERLRKLLRGSPEFDRK